MREEQRTITALVADLAGSTALAEALGGEEVKLVVGEAIGRVVGEVERLGGWVKDLAGDGVLAFFGAPTANEDDAERAARAALGILATIEDYGFQVARGWGVEPLGVRVGICTGPVALGPVGAGRRIEYAAFGDTVNTAARLQAAAAPGTVLVDARTHRLVEPRFAWGEPVDLELKGKAEPVRAFPLRGPTTAQRIPGPGATGRLVGRDRERSALRKALEEVRSGAGGVVLISGAAGLGKTRLVADAREARPASDGAAPGAVWLEGRCASYAETVPYYPFCDLVRDWLGVGEGDPGLRVRVSLRRAVVEQLGERADEVYPHVASMLGVADAADGPGGDGEMNAEQLQQWTFAAVGTLLASLARERPVVVVLEDLHWADATSVQLLRSLLPVVEAAPVLLLLTQRDERDHVSWGLREAAVRDFPHLVRELPLEPLEPDSERELLHELLGPEQLTDELERRLLDAGDGNPFFLEELARSLVESGAVGAGAESDRRLEGDVPVVLPETVEKVILARADRLSPAAHAVLRAASVVGREFDPALLMELVDGVPSLDDALHELQRAGFVAAGRRWPRSRYRFKHVLIQEAVYRTLLTEERARLHRRAAESLEGREEQTPELVLSLARHWAGAGAFEPAIAWYRRGAELALRAYANEEAVEALTAALDLLGRSPEGRDRDELELELRTTAGVPLVALGGYGAAAVGEQYSRARDLCVRLGRPVEAPILRGLAIHAVNRLRLDEAQVHSAALLAAAERDDDPILTVEAQYTLGVTSFWLGRLAAARRHLEEAIARYSPAHHETHVSLYSQDPKVICLSRLAWTQCLLGYPDRAAAARDEAVALAAELGHPYSSCYANVFGALTSLELRDDARADELSAAVEAQAADERYRLWQTLGAALRAWPAAGRGDPGAIGAIRAALDRLDEIGHPLFDTYLLCLVARGCLAAGNGTAGLDAAARALALTEQSGERYLEPELHRVRGLLLGALGAPRADCDGALHLAVELAQRMEARSLELRAALDLARLRLTEEGGGGAGAELARLDTLCGWFGEGQETPDLQEARRILSRGA